MYSFKIKFLTIKKEIGFKMESPNKKEVEGFVNDLNSAKQNININATDVKRINNILVKEYINEYNGVA